MFSSIYNKKDKSLFKISNNLLVLFSQNHPIFLVLQQGYDTPSPIEIFDGWRSHHRTQQQVWCLYCTKIVSLRGRFGLWVRELEKGYRLWGIPVLHMMFRMIHLHLISLLSSEVKTHPEKRFNKTISFYWRFQTLCCMKLKVSNEI